jgi:non-ribosomal peptide synthetase component F
MSAAAPTADPIAAPSAARTRHVLDLPLDRPRTAGHGADIRRTERTLGTELHAAMRSACAHAGFELFDGLLAAFVATLYRLSAQDDIAVGIPTQTEPASQWLALQLAPTAPMRFDALMGACQAGVLAARTHHDAQGRSPHQQTLTSVSFELEPGDNAGIDAPHPLDEPFDPFEPFEPFDLSLTLRPHASANGDLLAHARYNADLFDEASVQRWLEMFECVLRSAARKPGEPVGQLDVLSAEGGHALAALQPPPHRAGGANRFAHAGFMAHARCSPRRTAVRDGARRCSYGELDARCPTAWPMRCARAASAAASAWGCAWSAASTWSSRCWRC